MIFGPCKITEKLPSEGVNRFFVNLVFLIFTAILSHQAFANSPAALTYQGRILKSDGTPLDYNNVSFIFQITNPNGSCVIYQEQVTGYSFVNSSGVFDVPIGEGTIQYPLGGATSILNIFDNAQVFTCGRGQSISSTAPSGAGQVLRYDGTKYGPAFLALADIRAGITPFGGAFTNAGCNGSQSLYWQSSTDTFQCQSIAISDTQLTYSTSRNANTFLAAPDGSAGAPTFRAIASSDLPAGTLSGSGTTGYIPYYSAGNTIAESPLFSIAGKVGLGTTTPSFPFEVTRNAPGTISASGTTVTGTDTTFLSTFSVGDTIYCYGQARTIATVDSDTSLTVTAAFNPVPTGLAYTRSVAKYTGTVEIEGNGPSANGGVAGPLDLLVLKNTYTTHGWSVGSAIKFEGQNGIFAGRIGTSWNGGLNYGDMFIQTTGANPAVWISYNGNVAIGTTAAYAKFTTLASGARTSGITGVSFSNTSTSSTASINKIGLNIQSTGAWSGAGAVNTALVVNATGGTTNYAATFDGGNVGISNSSPGTLLHVGSAAVAAGTAVAQFETATGICTLTPATSGSGIACTSDESLKENIEEVSGNFAGAQSNQRPGPSLLLVPVCVVHVNFALAFANFTQTPSFNVIFL